VLWSWVSLLKLEWVWLCKVRGPLRTSGAPKFPRCLPGLRDLRGDVEIRNLLVRSFHILAASSYTVRHIKSKRPQESDSGHLHYPAGQTEEVGTTLIFLCVCVCCSATRTEHDSGITCLLSSRIDCWLTCSRHHQSQTPELSGPHAPNLFIEIETSQSCCSPHTVIYTQDGHLDAPSAGAPPQHL
jgi:hypothetical protein